MGFLGALNVITRTPSPPDLPLKGRGSKRNLTLCRTMPTSSAQCLLTP